MITGYMNRILERALLLLISLVFGGSAALARSLDPASALQTKDYAALVRLYQGEIDKSPAPTSTMYYNLGVAYMLMERRAEAIKHYEMALYLEPTHTEARSNLSLIYQKAAMGVDDGRSPVGKLFDPLCYSLSIASWSMLALVLFTLVIVGLMLFWLSRKPRRKRIGFYGAAVCLVLVLLANAAILHQYYYRRVLEHSLTLKESVAMYSSANQEDEPVATLPALSTLSLVSDEGDWLEVQLRDGRRAWIKTDGVIFPLMLQR